MGQRALIAYQRESGRWDVHYSHWGAVGLALEQPLRDGLQPGEEAGELESVPVAHNELAVDEEPMATVDRPGEAFDELDGWGHYEALYLVPAIGEVRAYLALSADKHRRRDDEPANTGVFVQPRAVGEERLTTAAAAKWSGWVEVLAKQRRRGDVDAEAMLDQLNTLAWENWGKRPKSAEVPDFSPLGASPMPGAVNVTAMQIEAEQRAVNPNR